MNGHKCFSIFRGLLGKAEAMLVTRFKKEKRKERKVMSFSSPPLEVTHTPAKLGSDMCTAYARKKRWDVPGQVNMATNAKRS